MWGSAFVGDTYDVPIHFSDEFSNMVVKALSQHPHFSYENLPVEVSSTLMVKEDLKKYSFAKTATDGLNLHGVRAQTILFVSVVKPDVAIKPTRSCTIQSLPMFVCSKQWRLKQPSNN